MGQIVLFVFVFLGVHGHFFGGSLIIFRDSVLLLWVLGAILGACWFFLGRLGHLCGSLAILERYKVQGARGTFRRSGGTFRGCRVL